jgi:chaperone BCS1
MDKAYERDEGKIVIFCNSGGSWRFVVESFHLSISSRSGSPRNPRALASVVLEERIKLDLRDDIKEFFTNSKFYKDLGIPYRRGYLLHGYPGSGKVQKVAGIAESAFRRV